jgi:hypothetical protein
VSNNVTAWLAASNPDIVLLHIGTNGLDVNNVSDVEAILNKVDTYSVDVEVVLARIIDERSGNPVVTQFNDALVAMANSRISGGDKIVIVDQQSALNYSTDMFDGLHPNQIGYDKMAAVWLGALQGILPICDDDADGHPNHFDEFPNDPAEWVDSDFDGIADNADADDDNDGMYDDWENFWGFDRLDPTDAALDADGDSLSNLQEYIDGSDPRPQGVQGVWSFEEASGQIAGDSSTYGNDGTISGNVTWINGADGRALSFAGGNGDVVIVPDAPQLDISGTLSIAAWIRPVGLGTQYVVKKSRSEQTDGYELSLSADGSAFVRFNDLTSDNTYRLDSLSSYPTDGSTWMHVVGVFDGNDIRMYVNGTLESTLAAPGLIVGTNNRPLAIGAQEDGLSPFRGWRSCHRTRMVMVYRTRTMRSQATRQSGWIRTATVPVTMPIRMTTTTACRMTGSCSTVSIPWTRRMHRGMRMVMVRPTCKSTRRVQCRFRKRVAFGTSMRERARVWPMLQGTATPGR